MASLRGVLTRVSSYCHSASGLLWRSAVEHPSNQARLMSTTTTSPMKPKELTRVTRNIPDHRRRLLAAKFELRRKLYKALCKDPELPSEMRDQNRYKLSKLPRNSSFVRVKNRCVITGRSRSVHALFRMSRICFRGLANKGALNGIIKSSW